MGRRLLNWSIVLLIWGILLAGCQEKEPDRGDEAYFKAILSQEYDMKSVAVEQIQNSKGVLQHRGQILVADGDGNSLVLLDEEGNFLRKIGQLGNGPLEFMNPTGLAANEEYVYVVDAGNNRVQILNDKLEYVREIELNLLSPDPFIYYTDIEVTEDGTIYITSNGVTKEEAQIFRIEDGNVKEIYPMYGFLYREGDRIWAMNSLEMKTGKNEWTVESGVNEIFFVEGENVEKTAELPYKTTPTDFVVANDCVYAINSGFGRLDKYNLNGEYVETIAKFEEVPFPAFLTMTEEGSFVVSDGDNKRLYFIEKRESK